MFFIIIKQQPNLDATAASDTVQLVNTAKTYIFDSFDTTDRGDAVLQAYQDYYHNHHNMQLQLQQQQQQQQQGEKESTVPASSNISSSMVGFQKKPSGQISNTQHQIQGQSRVKFSNTLLTDLLTPTSSKQTFLFPSSSGSPSPTNMIRNTNNHTSDADVYDNSSSSSSTTAIATSSSSSRYSNSMKRDISCIANNSENDDNYAVNYYFDNPIRSLSNSSSNSSIYPTTTAATGATASSSTGIISNTNSPARKEKKTTTFADTVIFADNSRSNNNNTKSSDSNSNNNSNGGNYSSLSFLPESASSMQPSKRSLPAADAQLLISGKEYTFTVYVPTCKDVSVRFDLCLDEHSGSSSGSITTTSSAILGSSDSSGNNNMNNNNTMKANAMAATGKPAKKK